jgi:hypothetical protein
MPPKQPDPQKELNILLQRARRNSRNPLLVKIVDWTGNPVQFVLLADADDWIRSRLQGMTVRLSDYLHCPRVIVVGSVEDPAAGIGALTRGIMLECGTHHLGDRQFSQRSDQEEVPQPLSRHVMANR